MTLRNRIAAVVATTVMAACAREAPEAPPTADDERELSRLESQLTSLAEAIPASATAGLPPEACRKLSETAEAICGVSDKICAIAGRHADRADMAQRCTKAQATCRQARDACSSQCPK